MRLKKELPFYVICDNIRSLENIGSIFRTADALGIDKIFLCGICGKPPNFKISKSALGSEKRIDWEYHILGWKLVEKLKRNKVSVIALEQTKKVCFIRNSNPIFPWLWWLGTKLKEFHLRF